MKDLWNYLMEQKKWWLLPIIIGLLFVAGIVMVAGSPVIAPFIYTVF